MAYKAWQRVTIPHLAITGHYTGQVGREGKLCVSHDSGTAWACTHEVRRDPFLRDGEHVRINDGPFMNKEGVIRRYTHEPGIYEVFLDGSEYPNRVHDSYLEVAPPKEVPVTKPLPNDRKFSLVDMALSFTVGGAVMWGMFVMGAASKKMAAPVRRHRVIAPHIYQDGPHLVFATKTKFGEAKEQTFLTYRRFYDLPEGAPPEVRWSESASWWCYHDIEVHYPKSAW